MEERTQAELTKREHVEAEILSTETSYVSGLESVLNNVAKPLQEAIGTSQELIQKGMYLEPDASSTWLPTGDIL
jgi:hypothetical protein